MKNTLIILISFIAQQYCDADTITKSDDSINFKTGLNIGSRTISFNQAFDQGALSVPGFSTQPAKRTADFTQTFRSADLSAAVSWSDFYVTANYETNIDRENGVDKASYTDASASTSNDHAFDFTRQDYAINVGWNAFNNFSIFTGYKVGDTDTRRDATLGTLGAPNGKIDSTFKESGPFVGISYSWVFEPGVLTFSTAYAYMAGKYDESGDEFIFAQVLSPTHVKAIVQNAMKYSGHTDGFSANLSWNVLTSEHFAYYYGARWQRYEFTANTDITWTYYDVNTGVPPSLTVIPFRGTGDVTNEESITALYAGINYLF